MKIHLLAASILAVPFAAIASGAMAQPIEGVYIGAGGGANFMSNERVRTVTSGSTTVSVPSGLNSRGFQTGYTGLGSVGWGFGNGVRLEVEGSYRHNEMSFSPPAGTTASGTENKYGVMGNVLFDMDIGSPYVFPYLGAGAGYQWVHQDVGSRTVSVTPGVGGAGVASTTTTHLSGNPGGFAYQAMAGLSFPIPGVVGLSVTTEFRYLGLAGDRKYSGTATSSGGFGLAPAPITTAISNKVTSDNNYSLMLGVRYAFNVVPPSYPSPVPVAAPAPQASRSYVVFFDWDKADLSARARQIVAEAAQASTHVAVTRIEVSGYADRTGTAQYNQALSRRRADNVAAELVRDGVPKAAISVMAFGDTKLLVPTAAGVREPQNRRVEIVLK